MHNCYTINTTSLLTTVLLEGNIHKVWILKNSVTSVLHFHIAVDIGGGDGGARGAMPSPPHFYGTLFVRKDQDTLIEQSGSGYSNRAVTVFREAV